MAEVENLRRKKIELVVVGVTKNVDEGLLRSLVTSSDYYFSVKDFDKLEDILTRLTSQACVTLVPPKPTLPSPTRKSPILDIQFCLLIIILIYMLYFK